MIYLPSRPGLLEPTRKTTWKPGSTETFPIRPFATNAAQLLFGQHVCFRARAELFCKIPLAMMDA
jgi:hypothetical protein